MLKKITFFIFAVAALILAIAASVYVWFLVQQHYMQPTSSQSTTTQTSSAKTSASSTTGAAYVIPANKLTDGQKALAKTMGLDVTSSGLTITQAQYQCAVAKLGATRMQEIINGATPSFSEGLALYSCK